jgi:hypothetical protein
MASPNLTERDIDSVYLFVDLAAVGLGEETRDQERQHGIAHLDCYRVDRVLVLYSVWG